MVDEFSVNFPYQKRTFISKLNPESPPFEPSSNYQHIQEVSQLKFTSEDNNNHLHIQPITNGHQDNQNNYYSTTIHSTEPSEYIPSQTHYIQEIKPDYQQSTTSSHIEPVIISYNDKKEENTHQISFQQSTNEEVLNVINDKQTNFDTQSNEKPNEISVDRSPSLTEINTPSNRIHTHLLTEPESTSSLPDVVAETLEQNSDNSVRETEPDDILGNKSLLKQIITPGIYDTRPTRNSLATVSYKLFLIDDATLNSHLIETIANERFFIGEYDILPAIDISIQLMDHGEHALIDSDVRHCYGENGCEEKQIPPISSKNSYRMKIDIEFHDWKDADEIQTLTIDERLYWGDKKRQRGNFLYRRKDLPSALQNYQNALKFLDTTEYPLSQEEDNQSSILINRYIQVQNNLAQVYLLNNKYEECLNAVNNVLKYDSNNIKGLFRQGKALIELGNYDHALQPLKLLLQNSSKDVEREKVKEMLNFCETKLAKYQKNEKEIYKRMFQSKTTINEKPQIKNIEKIENKTNWWTYVAVGSAALAAVGLAAIIKYR